jgi:hypothetical protein
MKGNINFFDLITYAEFYNSILEIDIYNLGTRWVQVNFWNYIFHI